MIDDIAYLKENSTTDSIAFYIDSTTRDVRFWPTPSEYSIQFEQPFRFVYGFDILDAAIPTTQYNIESFNNTLAFTMFMSPPTISALTLEPHVFDIANADNFISLFENKEDTKVMLMSPEAAETHNIRALSSSIPADTKTYVFIRHVITNVPIRVQKHVQESLFSYVFNYDNTNYSIPQHGNSTIIDIIEQQNYALHYNFENSTIIYYEKCIIDDVTYSLLSRLGEFIMKIENYRIQLEVGNYDMSTLRNEFNNLLTIYDFNVETTTPVENKQGRYRFFSNKHMIAINGQLSTIRNSIGLSVPVQRIDRNIRALKVKNNPLVFLSVYDTADDIHKIEAPGLITLFGQRFIILKIKEIEDHLLGSYAYMSYSPGIGLFRLAPSFDIANVRFDYTSLVRKPFHPIGKIAKLTLRFETSKGELYDFKGVNHQLLMVIKFYVPIQKIEFSRSVLNPNYDPNFIRYMANNKTIMNKEGSDDEEEFLDNHNMNKYRKALRSYRSSSSSNYEEYGDRHINTNNKDEDTEGSDVTDRTDDIYSESSEEEDIRNILSQRLPYSNMH